ncbi:TIGR02996 domain-containing protein [Pyxidicoccus sp. MSG2]|uniref:TIGR02996 domain-containing protein n=1 Tax=Pyxidicoccus sp. MSG2 TaxID=2996790 RepID=UPI00226F5567|nr:TIGR02996 domain-containing protein [Pyxidicoccus sp. MSG2]MCY1018691.1 TIGR02996 domain-containing protein [Pyxidicoccus sp. MSG2]
MVGDVNGLLERALEAFGQHEEQRAMESLLLAWWESRSERLAALVERLSARIDAWPLPSRKRPSPPPFEDVPRDYFILMAYAREGNVDAVIRQLGMLGYGSPDPRLTPVLMELSRLPIGREGPIVQGLCGPLLFLKDPRTLELLRALSTSRHVEDEHADALKGLIEKMTAQPPPPLAEETQARVGALEAALDARASAEASSAPLREELLARVYSRPDDDDARLVLADHLLEHGDAAGEFIVLQCSPHSDEKRIWELQGHHRRTWEAPLGPYVRDGLTRFERGFPVAVRMNFDLFHSPAVLTPAGPAWGTVREISWSHTLTQAALVTSLEWLKSPYLRGVTATGNVHPEIARRLRDWTTR